MKQLTEAVRETLQDYTTPFEDLPLLGISWTNVARLLLYHRRPRDYSSKWADMKLRSAKKKKYGKQPNDMEVPRWLSDAKMDLAILEVQ